MEPPATGAISEVNDPRYDQTMRALSTEILPAPALAAPQRAASGRAACGPRPRPRPGPHLGAVRPPLAAAHRSPHAEFADGLVGAALDGLRSRAVPNEPDR